MTEKRKGRAQASSFPPVLAASPHPTSVALDDYSLCISAACCCLVCCQVVCFVLWTPVCITAHVPPASVCLDPETECAYNINYSRQRQWAATGKTIIDFWLGAFFFVQCNFLKAMLSLHQYIKKSHGMIFTSLMFSKHSPMRSIACLLFLFPLGTLGPGFFCHLWFVIYWSFALKGLPLSSLALPLICFLCWKWILKCIERSWSFDCLHRPCIVDVMLLAVFDGNVEGSRLVCSE